MVAGALQDNRRGVLLGTQTFGESSIESVIPLPGAGAIRLTTSRFTTPTGRQIQGKGLSPDLAVMPLKLEKLTRGGRREADLRGALKNTDPDSKAPAQASASAPISSPAQKAPSVATGDIGSADHLKPGEGAVVRRGLKKIAAYRDETGMLHTMTAVCPHLKCIVHWNRTETTWDCPCHGSRFDALGKVLNGPSVADLHPIEHNGA